MRDDERLRIAIQRSGRLSKRSLQLLERCGIDLERSPTQLISRCGEFPLDVMYVRDDDIPEYVRDGVCDIGIVGENVLAEKVPQEDRNGITVLRQLGFGRCRLCIAVPEGADYDGPKWLAGKRIATSYPATLGRYLADANVVGARLVELAGSVEIAPALEIADAVCDLVSTGSTLRSNGLRESTVVLESQAVLVGGEPDTPDTPEAKEAPELRQRLLQRLLRRIDGVLRASRCKYIMLNAPRAALEQVHEILPGLEAPTVIPLMGDPERVAVHAVAAEDIFWDTMDRLAEVGAKSILVTPIEKMIP